MKSIILVALASLLLVSATFAYDKPVSEYEEPGKAPSVVGICELYGDGLAKACLWAWILTVQPEVLDCKWFAWAFRMVEGEFSRQVAPA